MSCEGLSRLGPSLVAVTLLDMCRRKGEGGREGGREGVKEGGREGGREGERGREGEIHCTAPSFKFVQYQCVLYV